MTIMKKTKGGIGMKAEKGNIFAGNNLGRLQTRVSLQIG